MSQLRQPEQRSQSAGTAELDTVDIFELIYWLIDHLRQIILATVVGILIMGVYSFLLVNPVYSATSSIYVLSSSDSAINLSDLQIGSYLTSDYQHVFDVWEVHEMVLQRLGLDYTYDELGDMLEITNPTNTRVLNITVSSPDPQEAADLANTYAAVASDYISATMKIDAPTLMSQALLPENPVSPRKMLNLFLGAAGGAFLMVLFLMMQYLLDDKIKTEDDITKYLELPVLSVLPYNANETVKLRRTGARHMAKEKRGTDGKTEN